MKKLYKVTSANKALTYREAIDFLWHTQGINERNAQEHLQEVE